MSNRERFGSAMFLTRGKKAAVIGFFAFLVFMAVCTVAAKGIYRSGLAQVTAQTPYSSSLVHEIKANGTVKQGQEYGVFTESGLRVSAVSVRKGDYFEPGTPLFQVDLGDLQRIIEGKELEIEKLRSLWREQLQADQRSDREQRTAVVRSREDYDHTVREADARIDQCRQALDTARQELELYDRFLALLPQDAPGVSGGDAGAVTPEQQYSQQEKRMQLSKEVISCTRALEEAERSKEAALQAAGRAIEDAEGSLASNPSAGAEALDIAWQEKELARLRELMERDGWIYSEAAGRVTECRLAVGERTQDGAGILYAADDGEKIIEAVFTEGSGSYLTLNAELSLKAILPGGSRISGKVPLSFMETLDNGDTLAEVHIEDSEMKIGQNVELSYRAQTENYAACVPVRCVHSDGQGGDYVYVAEEREGILGTEWRVRKVFVTVLDRTDSVAAVESAEITTDTRIIADAAREWNEGDAVRLISNGG